MLFEYKNLISLNQNETKILQYCLENINDIPSLNVKTLAENTFFSTATIVRFYKKLGCKDFNEFKDSLLDYAKRNYVITKAESLSRMNQFIMHMMLEEFDEKIDKAVEMIMDAKEICFFGIGTSGAMAMYGARYFSNIGYYSYAISDPFYPTPVKPNDESVIIALSESGETIEILDRLKNYKNMNYKVIAITNSETSSINKYADLSLTYDTETRLLPQTFNVTTQVPVIFIIETIANQLDMKSKNVLPLWSSKIK